MDSFINLPPPQESPKCDPSERGYITLDREDNTGAPSVDTGVGSSPIYSPPQKFTAQNAG